MVWREGKGREEYRYVTSIIIKVITTHTHTKKKKKKLAKQIYLMPVHYFLNKFV